MCFMQGQAVPAESRERLSAQERHGPGRIPCGSCAFPLQRVPGMPGASRQAMLVANKLAGLLEEDDSPEAPEIS